MAFTVPLLQLTLAPQRSPATLCVGGEIDFATANQLREAVLHALVHEAGVLHLDLGEVTFMDTSGVHVLVASGRRAALLGGHLGVVRPSARVVRLLHLAGLGLRPGPDGCGCERLTEPAGPQNRPLEVVPPAARRA